MKFKTIISVVFILLTSCFSYAQTILNEGLAIEQNAYFDIPKTNIQLIPPAHFRYIEEMNGFLHVGTSSSVQVQEITGTAYQLITKGLTQSHFESQNTVLIHSEDVVLKDGQKGQLFTVGFKVDDVEFERLMLFTGDYNTTIWINANYPVVVKDMLNVVLRESLLTAKFIK